MSAAGAAVLFDLDGTLTDNSAGITGSILHALTALGVAHPDDAALRRCMGPPLRESFASLLDTHDSAAIEHAITLYRERFATIGWQENRVYPGIDQVLADLSARGLRLIVCTSKPALYARRIVDHFGLAPRFHGVYGPELSGSFDDKRDLLAHLLAAEGLDAARCTMIGDRMHDIRAGKVNGTRTIGVLWGYGSRAELAGAAADAIVTQPGELPALLDASA